MEEGGADTGEAPTTEELERDFDAALKAGSAPTIAETGLRLAASYSSNDSLAQALDALRLALKRGDYSDHLDPEAEICAELGSILHYRMHDSLGAETWYRRAIELFESTHNVKRRADMHYNLGNTLRALGQFDEAMAVLRAAINGFEMVDLPLDATDSRIALAVSLKAAGDDKGAQAEIAHAAAVARREQTPLRPVQFLAGLGQSLEWSDEEQAIWATRAAIDLVKDNVDNGDGHYELAHLLTYLGRQEYRRGHPGIALETARQSIRILREIDDAEALADALCDLGMAHLMLGDLSSAERVVQQISAINSEDPHTAARRAHLRGSICLQRGDASGASDAFAIAAVGYRETGDAEFETLAMNDRGAALLSLGRTHDAIQAFRSLADAATTPMSRAVALMNLALALPEGDPGEIALAEEAHRLLRWRGELGVKAGVNLSLVHSVSDSGSQPRAEVLASEAITAIAELPHTQQPSPLVELGMAVETWNAREGRSMMRRAARAARKAGNSTLEAFCHHRVSLSWVWEENWGRALRSQRKARRILGKDAGLHVLPHDVNLSVLLLITSGTSRRAALRRAREAADLAVPALLALESERRTVPDQSARVQLGWSNEVARGVALEACGESGQLDVVAHLIMYLHTVGIPEPHLVPKEELWRHHERLSFWRPSKSLDVGVSPEAPIGARLSVGLAPPVASADTLNVSLPPRIRLPDGDLILARQAVLARERYGVEVFSDTVVSLRGHGE